MINLKAYVVLLLMIANSANAENREDTICGWFQERFYFWLWSSAAPAPDKARMAHNDLIKSVEFTTADNRILRGYKYHAQDNRTPISKPEGYVLMALGNAMIADQMIAYLEPFSVRGFDAFIFDYRGYGRSQGKRRINAIIEDYKELVKYFNARYKRHLLYGVSLGGAVIANVIGSDQIQFHRAVIDSSPSRFSPFGCPTRIDPVNNIPENASDLMVITGAADSVLGPQMTTELRVVAGKKGANVFHGENYAHPFMDHYATTHDARMNMIVNFLTKN